MSFAHCHERMHLLLCQNHSYVYVFGRIALRIAAVDLTSSMCDLQTSRLVFFPRE